MVTESQSRGARRAQRSTQRSQRSLGARWLKDSTISAISVLIVVSAVVTSGCRRDMQDQPKYTPLRASEFFPDDRSARPLVEGTVSREHLGDDTLLETGKIGNDDATVFPFAVDARVVGRGRERYDIYCSPCHGRTGAGDGMIVQRGFRRPPSYHEERLRNAPVGYFFDVMTNGFGAMQDYAAQIPVQDRWAIAAYIRALQYSQNAKLEDVPTDHRADLDRPDTGAAPEAR